MKKNKYGDFRRTVVFPVFSRYGVHVVFTDDIARSKKHRYGNDRDCDNAEAMHIPNVGGTSYLLFKYDAGPRIIAHECWHAVRGLLLWVGAELDNEVVAYHLGYLVGEVHKFSSAVKSSTKKR
jgi:hypothetical protein